MNSLVIRPINLTMDCDMGVRSILHSQKDYFFRWPQLSEDFENSFYAASIEGRVLDAIAEGWNVNIEDLQKQIRNDDPDDDKAIKAPIGTINGQPIIERAYVLVRP